MRVPLLDLSASIEPHRDELQTAIDRVLREASFIQGPDVGALEREILAYLEAPGMAAVGCANGSDAIVLVLMAEGIGPGDEVIVPDFTFVSTATSVALVQATPVFVDVEASTFAIRIDAVIDALTPRTRAVMPVHLFGRATDVPALRKALDAAGRPDVIIIEDTAQALGARIHGQPVCTFGDYATLSFFPSKNLGCFGDGGMIIARDASRGRLLRMLTQHGSEKKYYAEHLGYNSRLDTLQAAILRTRLPHLNAWCDERRAHADRWRAALSDGNAALHIALPDGDDPATGGHHIYNQFTIRTPHRDALQAWLTQAGVGTAVYYPRPLSAQPCLQGIGRRHDANPVAYALCDQVISLPVYPGLTPEAHAWAAEQVRAFVPEAAP